MLTNIKLNWANRITILRMLLIIPFVSLMLKINDQTVSGDVRNLLRYASILIFVVMALSDAFDGFLARKGRQITRLGTFLDPMADKLLMACACLLLASERGHVDNFRLPTTVVVLIIGKDAFLLIGFVIVFFLTSKVHIIPAPIGKAATALQLAMVLAILIAPEVSGFFAGWIWFLRFLWWSAAAIAVITTLIYIRNGSKFLSQFEQKSQ